MTIYNHHEGNQMHAYAPSKQKKLSESKCFVKRLDMFFEGFPLGGKKKATGMLRVPWALVFLFEVIFASLSAPPRKRGETACVCVCFVWLLLSPLRFHIMSLYKGYLFHVSKSQKKKNGLRNGFDHSPFPCIKDSRTRGIIHITILFSRPKNHDENNKKIQHNIWHTLHDSNILLSNIRSLRSKSWNGYWEISWLWKLNESKRREGLEGLLLGRVPHWEGWDVGFAVKWSNLTSIFFAWVVQPPTR